MKEGDGRLEKVEGTGLKNRFVRTQNSRLQNVKIWVCTNLDLGRMSKGREKRERRKRKRKRSENVAGRKC
ncbi:hypothetical protein SLEP1_g55096 [Rubroshorea leprosula]|uniref:Uncharacterized protein n=1 Tax=Rubroshorea leprosula TaxID=152421 RepID=A0AAV5MF83_9ROSI|nr:hypothetical protein SLEP1_g55096 [Rubroshorea leprosula]